MSAAVQQNPQLLVKLSVVKGPHAGQNFQFTKTEITIGRGPENDVVLLNDPQASRAHAKIVLVERDFEVINLSQKNAVFVNGENVDRWKLVNNQNFIIGESEFQIEYDLGQAVASVPARPLAPVVPLKPKTSAAPTPVVNAPVKKPGPLIAKPQGVAAPKTQNAVAPQRAMPPGMPRQGMPPAQMQPRPNVMGQQGFQSRTATPIHGPSGGNSKLRFYLIALIGIGALLYFVMSPTKKPKVEKAKPILKYEDEIAIKLNSTPQKELDQKRLDLKEEKNSPQALRARENFIKGMRDFHLGNYARSMDFFQVVLNLEPDHALARRHYYLAKVRFDELVQAKLMLGDSYYKKHNFKMCESMYNQVMDMLGEKKTNDPKYILANRKAEECKLAAEGIR